MDNNAINPEQIISDKQIDLPVHAPEYSDLRQVERAGEIYPEKEVEDKVEATIQPMDDVVTRVTPDPGSIPEPIFAGNAFSAPDRQISLKAEDRDVIEPGWIQRVNETISRTKNQPMKRNDEIEEIRRVYQTKRRGGN